MIKLEASEITMFIPLPLESQYELIVKLVTMQRRIRVINCKEKSITHELFTFRE